MDNRVNVGHIVSKLIAENAQSLHIDELKRCFNGCVVLNIMIQSAIQLIEEGSITYDMVGKNTRYG